MKRNLTKAVLLRLHPDDHATFKAKAKTRRMPLTGWILQACFAYEAKSDRYYKKKAASALKWKSGWPKDRPCSLGGCGKKHDPADHGLPVPLELLES